MRISFFSFAIIIIFAVACQTSKPAVHSTSMSNSLTNAEKASGWQLLFDGKSLDQWKGWKQETPGAQWEIKDGAMSFNPKAEGKGGDIITKDKYEDYELSLEWMISDCGNSGIMFGIIEDEKYQAPWMTGPEMQVLDDKCHPDGKIVTHRAGDLYDMIETSEPVFTGANKWQQVRIKSLKGAMEFWLNGVKVVEFTMHTPEWDKMISESKFKDFADFGQTKEGHIGLQDHHDFVSFKNIKIRRL